jgi:hypothetical protein
MPNSLPAPCAADDGSLWACVGMDPSGLRPAEAPSPVGVPAGAVYESLRVGGLRCVGWWWLDGAAGRSCRGAGVPPWWTVTARLALVSPAVRVGAAARWGDAPV